jgi:hypothetical protein
MNKERKYPEIYRDNRTIVENNKPEQVGHQK